jgi:hypothetical protein
LQKKKKEKKKKESSKQRWRRLFDTFSKKMRPRVRLNCFLLYTYTPCYRLFGTARAGGCREHGHIDMKMVVLRCP